jgi:hypothetical protein
MKKKLPLNAEELAIAETLPDNISLNDSIDTVCFRGRIFGVDVALEGDGIAVIQLLHGLCTGALAVDTGHK